MSRCSPDAKRVLGLGILTGLTVACMSYSLGEFLGVIRRCARSLYYSSYRDYYTRLKTVTTT